MYIHTKNWNEIKDSFTNPLLPNEYVSVLQIEVIL